MLKGSISVLLALIWTAVSFAQPDDPKAEKREQIHAQKIAFISTELNLTPDEAQKFWPVYNQYEEKIEEIRKTRRNYMRELRKPERLTEERAYELFQLIFESEKEESNVRLSYLDNFARVVGKKKAAQVFIAEEKFKRELLQKLKEDGPHGPPPPDDRRPN